MEMMIPRATNVPSGNNQVLTLKPGYFVGADALGIGLTSVTFTYSAPPKGGFWFSTAADGSEYEIIVRHKMKS